MKNLPLEISGRAKLPLRLALRLGVLLLLSAFCLRVAAQSYSIDWYKLTFPIWFVTHDRRGLFF